MKFLLRKDGKHRATVRVTAEFVWTRAEWETVKRLARLTKTPVHTFLKRYAEDGVWRGIEGTAEAWDVSWPGEDD